MAKFSQSSISQLGGFNEAVLAQELLYGVDTYYNITITDSGTGLPYDLTNWTFAFRLIRRGVTSVSVNRWDEIDVVGLTRLARELEMNLDTNVKVFNPTGGVVRLLIDNTFFSAVPSLIDSDAVPVYTGYLQATLPAIGTVGSVGYIPPQNKKVLLMFVIRSDGVLA